MMKITQHESHEKDDFFFFYKRYTMSFSFP